MFATEHVWANIVGTIFLRKTNACNKDLSGRTMAYICNSDSDDGGNSHLPLLTNV